MSKETKEVTTTSSNEEAAPEGNSHTPGNQVQLYHKFGRNILTCKHIKFKTV